MAYGLKLIPPGPVVEPLDLEPTKLWLRQDHSADDTVVQDLIVAARERCERVTDRQLVTATWELTLPGFPTGIPALNGFPVGASPYPGLFPYGSARAGWFNARGFNAAPPDLFSNALRIPLPPLQSVTSISYLDFANMTQILDAADYRVVTSREPGIVVPAVGKTWPVYAAMVPDAVTVRFVCGYGAAAAVPAAIRSAMRRCIAYEYEFRDKPEIADEDYLDRLFQPFAGGGYV